MTKPCNFVVKFFYGALFLAISIAAFGQASTSLRGTIKDASGALVTDAAVTLLNPSTQFERTTTTGSTGEYQFLQVPPGTYTLRASRDGFRQSEQKDLQLLVNLPATANLILQVGSRTESVEVSSEGQAINLVDATLGIAFGETQVKQLPLEARNVPDLLSLQAGVVYTGNRPDINRDNDTRSGAVNGARSDQSNITLDGVDVNDQGNGYAFSSVLPVTLDSVQEFRVTTSNYNADSGRSSGAQVSLVTKSGTNQFHGSLYEYHRNTITSANDWFIKQSEAANGLPNTPPKLIRNIFGGSIGGPLIKNRLFFFANYEATRQREENSVLRVVPSMQLRAGVLQYPDVNGGVTTLSATDITNLDPLHLGANSAVLQYFQSFPTPNDTSVGDGLNFVGYRFKGPISSNKNDYIGRVDYKITANGDHSLFWRGAVNNSNNSDVPYLPGGVPSRTLVDFSKGFVLGYTASLRPTLVNNFRWGFTRQSFGIVGNSSQPWIIFRGLNDNAQNSTQAFTRTRDFQMPVHNFVDDLAWVKGRHSMTFGTNVSFLRNPRTSYLGSFSDGVANAAWFNTGGFANKASALDPTAGGFPEVDPNFNNSYDFPMVALLGMVSEVDATYNYNKDGTQRPQGAPVQRHFAMDSYEFYGQDAFRLKPNVTVTFGLRWSIFSPPWETTGLQVAPNVSLGNLVSQRTADMLAGTPSNQDPLIQFNLAGPANGKRGYYNWQTKNFAPRLAIAYAPRPQSNWLKKLVGSGDQTSIRAGFGIVYDHIGMGLLNTFDQNGSFGLATGLSNPAGIQTVTGTARLTDIHNIPTTNKDGKTIFFPAPPGTFPQTPPATADTGGFAIAWGLDDTIRAPYSYTFDVSVGRELPKKFSIEASYVGRLARHLLSQRDLMMPLDLVDQKSKIDYFAAARQLSKLYGSNAPIDSVTSANLGKTAAYWQNMMQPLVPGGSYALSSSLGCPGTASTDVVQVVYNMYNCFAGNDTSSLSNIDVFNGIVDANSGNPYTFKGGPSSFFNRQYSSLYAWSTMGNSNYNALEVSLRKQMGAGVQFDLNYTYSKSIDISSDAERIAPYKGFGGQVINTWSPNQLRAVSDYDLPHQINANWIVELPFGKGRRYANASGLENAVIGGWQLTGLARWTSGFPVTVDNGYFFPTNWELEGNAIQTAPVHMGVSRSGGNVNMFTNGTAAQTSFRYGMPGESGSRNTFRGQGFAGLDMSLGKRWQMPYAESHSVQFRWEVFNVTNLHRFDAQQNRPELDIGSTFGNYIGLLTQPRIMQFALRYEF
ncbi:MAG: hypothetical protein JWO91_3077 [Acidobacteriaceae bacterium]|nr:hypothetical protein [Acidobacteriaceae bacterium]